MAKKKAGKTAKPVETATTAPAEDEEPIVVVDEPVQDVVQVTPPTEAEVYMSEVGAIRAEFQPLITQMHELKRGHDELKASLMKVASKVNNL